MRNDRTTILNHIVAHAADLMEAQKEYNELVIDQLVLKGKDSLTVAKLTEENRRIIDAVVLMRENGGCWA